MLVFLLFFLSGATALVYEVVWSKYLALIFGSTIQAQTVVLAAFMGGLAIGNRIFGRVADSLKHPLEYYGYIEFVIGLYAFFFNALYLAADRIFISLGEGRLDQGLWLLALKGTLSALLLLAPTVLMGGTLPLIAAWLRQHSEEAGRLSARFYAINTFGAVAGAGLAGFFLVPALGLVSSLQMTAFLNLLIGLTAVGLSRFQEQRAQPARSTGEDPKTEGLLPAKHPLAWASLLVAFTGGVSMGLEVLASRALSLIFGASLPAFAVVLMSFILGIGTGSAIISSPRFKAYIRPATTIYLLLAASYCLGLFVATIEEWAVLYAKIRSGLAGTEMGYFFNQIMITLISAVVLGLPAALLGAVLPMAIRLLAGQWQTLGECVGRLLTWNTLGAVAGVLLTGFWLMPAIGLRNALIVLALALCLAALLGALRNRAPRPAVSAAVLAGLLIWVSQSGGEKWKHALASGVFRLRSTEVSWNLMEQRHQSMDIIFYEDSADATVSVETRKGQQTNKDYTLRINGKPDASTTGDLATQYLLAHLPMLAKPEAKEVFVLGFGSGITGGALLGHPIELLHIAENCEPVLKAASIFEPWNRSVLADSRTRVFREDGRTVLKLSPQTYDLIISEPSNPWVAGIGSVFSKEFYQLSAGRLKAGGIMAQWFHIYEMHDEIVNMVIRTFGSVFPVMEIWDSQEGDIILLGSEQPWTASPEETFWRVYNRELPRKDLLSIGLRTEESVWARQIASQQTAFAVVGDGPIQSDLFPILEYAAPKAFFIGSFAQQIFQFDERTWQSALAPEPKRATLAALPYVFLEGVFEFYNTSNRDLSSYLKWRRNLSQKELPAIYHELPYLPVIFHPDRPYPEEPKLAKNASLELTKLTAAQSLISTKPEAWQEGARQIEELLKAYQALPEKPDQLDWQPGYFASVAARACAAHQESAAAERIIEIGLELSPQDAQLLYLQRVLSRLASRRSHSP